MTLVEAIKSGKRFKRDAWLSWYTKDELEDAHISYEDVLADDWETEEPKPRLRLYLERTPRGYGLLIAENKGMVDFQPLSRAEFDGLFDE